MDPFNQKECLLQRMQIYTVICDKLPVTNVTCHENCWLVLYSLIVLHECRQCLLKTKLQSYLFRINSFDIPLPHNQSLP